MTNDISTALIGIKGKEGTELLALRCEQVPSVSQKHCSDHIWETKVNTLCLWQYLSTTWNEMKDLTPGTGLTRAQENWSDSLSYTFLKWISWSTLVSDQR